VINAVNTPSVTGDLLAQLGPFLRLAGQIGALQAQLSEGPIGEVAIEYAGDYKDLDLEPVTTALLKGLLTPMLKEDVNFVNAPVIARNQGMKITETFSSASEEYLNLITVTVSSARTTHTVSGTLFGKQDSRIVKINRFRLEMIPSGHLALIYNIDKPGSIGQIGTTLGKHNINIDRMQVGQEEQGDRNIIFLATDKPIPAPVVDELAGLSLVKTVIPLEF